MYIALGDSIMKGVMYSEPSSASVRSYRIPNRSMTDYLSGLLNQPILNLGRFGATVSVVRAVLERNLSLLEVDDVVFIEIGGNDSNYNWLTIAKQPDAVYEPATPYETFISVYGTIISTIRSHSARPILLSLPPLDADRYFDFFTRDWGELQKRNILHWLGGGPARISAGHDLYNIAIFHLATAYSVPMIDITTSFLRSRDYSLYLCADGLHFNEQGQAKMADIIYHNLTSV